MVRHVGKTQEGLELVEQLSKFDGDIKVTKITEMGFNEMEGYCYTVRVKATAPAGKVWKVNNRQSLLFEFDTNSTWIETSHDDDLAETEQERIEWMVYDCCL